MKSYIYVAILTLLFFSCTNSADDFPGLKKLSSKELIERGKNNQWPDVTKVVYVMNGDTITIDSVQKLNYHEIAFDDYVDKDGEVIVAVVRTATADDLEVRKRMGVIQENNLDGQLETIQIQSESLNPKRPITVYRSNRKPDSNIYFYFADGSVVKDVATLVNDLIQNNEIIPINLIGIHSDPENRFREYVKNHNHVELFDNHLNYFTKEVPNRVESESENSKVIRYLFGFSSGADFSNHVGINKPNWATKIMAMSGVAYFPSKIDLMDKHSNFPDFYLSSGIEEEQANLNLSLKNQLEEIGAKVSYVEHPGGHDYEIWKKRLIEFIHKEFGCAN